MSPCIGNDKPLNDRPAPTDHLTVSPGIANGDLVNTCNEASPAAKLDDLHVFLFLFVDAYNNIQVGVKLSPFWAIKDGHHGTNPFYNSFQAWQTSINPKLHLPLVMMVSPIQDQAINNTV